MSILRSKQRLFSLESPKVMGILNCTPDSFHNQSRVQLSSVVDVAGQMLVDGADILDLGGQSTRPGAEQIEANEEKDRVLLPITELRKNFPQAWISIDTYHSSVAKEAVEAGADFVNDISAGLDDPLMLSTVAQLKVPYIAMHKKGSPQTMQQNPQYQNPTKEIVEFFIKRLQQIRKAGINDCIIDPGFGFGKTIEHNYTVLNQLQSFSIFSEPLLVGLSRKSLIWKALEIDSYQALNGTTFLHAFALNKGAKILRVHDVKEAKQCIQLFGKLNTDASEN